MLWTREGMLCNRQLTWFMEECLILSALVNETNKQTNKQQHHCVII